MRIPAISRWVPRYIVNKAGGVGGPPIQPDEPLLVIRAQDMLAELMLVHYINTVSRLPVEDQVNADLYEHLDALTEWRQDNQHKIKLPDR